jgi:tetratricopeptide (TPR) repeat protein
MVCAWKQAAYWQDGETLWSHTLACTTGNYVAHGNLGNIFLQEGRLDEAMDHYQKALKISPDYAEARDNIGNVFLRKGQLDEAIAQFQKVLDIKPDFASAYYGIGRVLQLKGRVDEAIAQFQKALDIKPDFAEAHCTLGNLFLQKERMDEAAAQYQKALEISANYTEAHNNLGYIFMQEGNMSEAAVHFQKVLQIDPSSPGVQNNLAWVLATCPQASLRNGTKAVELARQANAATGGENPMILHTLAAAYAEAGRFSEAVDTAQRALHLAQAQSNTWLAGQLRAQVKLYQAGSPFRSPAQTHAQSH